MPRKRKVQLSDEAMKMIEGMAAIRLPNEYIATILGISRETFDEMVKTDETLRNTIMQGIARSKSKVFKTLYTSAVGREPLYAKLPDGSYQLDAYGRPIVLDPGSEPNDNLLKFWCQTQERMKLEDNKIEITGPGGGPIESRVVHMTIEQKVARLAELEALEEPPMRDVSEQA